MNLRLLASALPALYSFGLGLAYLPVLGPRGMLALSFIGTGSSLLLALFLLRKK